jgi:hypothetical protein
VAQQRFADPIPARRHRGIRTSHDVDAPALLTVYLVLLLAIPSNITITALGSLGRPALLWGVLMLVLWAVTRVQQHSDGAAGIRQPIRFAFAALLVVALVSLAAALLRGQPSDQVSPALTALVRLASWGGVLLVALDGLRTMADITRLVRRIAIGAGLLAGLGILQALTGQAIVDFFSYIPGLSGPGAGVAERGGVVRSAGTAIHPLEYATALDAALPLVIAVAVAGGFRRSAGKANAAWWIPAVLVATSALVGVSRSAIIGFALAAAAMIPILPRRYRLAVTVAGASLAAAIVAAVPGLLGTTLSLFTGASDDPSTHSRFAGLDRAVEFVTPSPVIGAGFGTFLPRYFIFDDQWVLMAVELGMLGTAAFAGLFVTAIWSALRARRLSEQPDVRLLGYALAVSIVVVAVLFAFFDGLSFPISAGMFFVLVGLCGATLTLGRADAAAQRVQHAFETGSAADDERG